MKRILIVAALACIGLFLVLPSAQAQGHRVFAMIAQNGSGESGAVVLTPLALWIFVRAVNKARVDGTLAMY